MGFWNDTKNYAVGVGKQTLKGGWVGAKWGFGTAAVLGAGIAALGALAITGVTALPAIGVYAMAATPMFGVGLLGGGQAKWLTAGIGAAIGIAAIAFAATGGLGAVAVGLGAASLAGVGGSALGVATTKFGAAVGFLDGLLFKGPRKVRESQEKEMDQQKAAAMHELQTVAAERQYLEEKVADKQASVGHRAPQDELTNPMFPDAAKGNASYHQDKFVSPEARERAQNKDQQQFRNQYNSQQATTAEEHAMGGAR